MKSKTIVFIFTFLLISCSSTPPLDKIQTSVAGTIIVFTPIPTYTPYPTLTLYPTYTVNPTYTAAPSYTPYPTATARPVVTRVVVQTPTPDRSNSACIPISNVDYSDNSKVFIALQNYVASLPDVRSVSYTIPERLYSNSLSHIVHVTYVSDSDGQVYSHRYIVYVKEFGWTTGIFSIDGQCWIDGPH